MLGWCAVLIKVYFFEKKTIALLQLLHYCNSFLGGQLLHIAIFNSFFSRYCYCNSSDGYCQCLVLNVYTRTCFIVMLYIGPDHLFSIIKKWRNHFRIVLRIIPRLFPIPVEDQLKCLSYYRPLACRWSGSLLLLNTHSKIYRYVV